MNKTTPKMRSILEVVDHIKKLDPDTRVSYSAIRSAIDQGFPAIKTGKSI